MSGDADELLGPVELPEAEEESGGELAVEVEYEKPGDGRPADLRVRAGLRWKL